MPGRINETYDQMHDYDIASYKVDFENMRLIITACSGKGDICDIIFTGLLAHKFENVGRQNILFDICNISTARFLDEYKDELPDWLTYMFPINAKDSIECKKMLARNKYKVYEINSSIGLCGFVIVQAIEIINRQVIE